MNRLRLLGMTICVALLLLIGRLFWMQVLHGTGYKEKAYQRIQHEKVLDPKRGQIFDRHGRPLVENTLAYDILLVPSRLEPGVLERLAGLLEMPVEELALRHSEVQQEVERWIESDLKRRFRNSSKMRQRRARRSLTRYFNKRAFLLVENMSDMDRLCEIFVQRKRFAGLEVKARSGRVYLQGDTACHIVGYMGRIWAEEFGRLRSRGYDQNDHLGRTGLEKRFEDKLRGTRGVEVTGRILGGGEPKVLFQELPVNGLHLRTTLDLELQKVCERALDERIAELGGAASKSGRAGPPGGAAIVLNVNTGEVLALASSPRYEPAQFGRLFRELKADRVRWPLLNRAIGGYRVPPPGSTFKILTAIAALAEGVVTPASTFNCSGYMHQPGKFRCWNSRGHGPINLGDAIEQSCNVYFYHVGQRLGGERLAAWGQAFGFGDKTGVELPRESPGIMPSPAWKWHNRGRQWFKADSRFTAIGQGMLATTPLQIARFMAAVATRGRLSRVRLLSSTPAEVQQIKVPDRVWDNVLRGMAGVVDSRSGTASRYGLAQYGFAAKTGTAEMGGKLQTHAWIAGFAPRTTPEIAVVVMVEHAGHGGEVTGPIVARILDAYGKRR